MGGGGTPPIGHDHAPEELGEYAAAVPGPWRVVLRDGEFVPESHEHPGGERPHTHNGGSGLAPAILFYADGTHSHGDFVHTHAAGDEPHPHLVGCVCPHEPKGHREGCREKGCDYLVDERGRTGPCPGRWIE